MQGCFHFIKMGIRSVWITTVPSPFYRWLRRSLKEQWKIQLLQHLDKSSRLSGGLRKNHSTQDAVTYFTDCIRKGIDEGCITAAVFVDFRKAFDSVNHQLLLKKLPGYGIKNHELRWFEKYLTSRCQSVVYGNAQSAPQQIKTGVSQGSILGPLLFSIYINDSLNSLLQSKILLYVDDAVLFYADSNIGNISTILNKTVATANKVYQSLVLPIMDYCDVTCSSIGKMKLDKLDRAQRRAVL